MSDKPILFISDLHLEPDRPDISQAFFDFLEAKASNAQALYILGDFFNVWLGDDVHTELSDQVARQLHALNAQGVTIKLMHGNRDFLMGSDYAQTCGAEMIKEPHLLTAFDKKVLLMHGDVLCTKDTDYMAFRQMVRNSDWQKEFLARSVEERIAYAAEARKQSQAMSSNKSDDIMDVTQEAVTDIMQAYAVDTLIHGHTHRPKVHELAKGKATRMVLGDWDQSAWYIIWDQQQLALHHLNPHSV
ncbi:MAG: UDP-2,3-diacylglucosamine diphosphatase [Alphaproteobacteria bacterium]|nr:UDP-2,3-diacylglucosamine diphosphatase [Alphaproteobacteria bacterium]